MAAPVPQLTLFYDHGCAICRAEMMRMARWDEQARRGCGEVHGRRGAAHGRLQLIDSSAPGFDAAAHGFTAQALDRELHALTAEGEVLKGLAAIRRAYALTRYGWLWKITAWPGLKPGFDRFYLWFARNRLAISHRLFVGRTASAPACPHVCTDACARKLKGSGS
jgi:predicted DCC family thiol-disulfide oxidoreductase YuxK